MCRIQKNFSALAKVSFDFFLQVTQKHSTEPSPLPDALQSHCPQCVSPFCAPWCCCAQRCSVSIRYLINLIKINPVLV